ncbi:hypothetical protein BKH45_02240 [Helicobacter sp. 11S03491-1]|nr:hypothetical protein BKH45_02240 [Helicobacter sp. 11S03491-1]
MVFAQDEASNIENTPKKNESFFSPTQATTNSYGAFKIGYVYQNLNSKSIPLKNGQNTYDFSSNNAYFGLERGYVGGPKSMIMAGGYLDAGAGDTYYLSAGASFGLRLLQGWVIPKISLGYELQHLSLPNDSSQYNIQSMVGTIGIFVNIAQSVGISLEARSGIPFSIVRSAQAKEYNHAKFNMYAIMISFAFYDFGI